VFEGAGGYSIIMAPMREAIMAVSRFDLTLKERIRNVALSTNGSKASAMAGMLASRLFGMSFAPTPADELLIVPQDLRTADPSFWREIEHGQFGLAGSIAFLRERSPFDIKAPTPGWERELHGFGWLRNLAAAGEEEARQTARRLAAEWAIRFGVGTGIVAEPAVAARRLISWLSHASLLLDGADAATYATITSSLGRQLAVLTASSREAPEGYPRLLALMALAFADMSIAGHDRHLKEVEGTLAAELGRQILSDGGHISRNPAILVELMLDLLPLAQCFVARKRKHPAQLLEVIALMFPMLRFMRLGDGMLARFNGMGIPSAAGLGTVLGYDDGTSPVLSAARGSNYARLERARTIVIADVGSPPPLPAAAEAQAGCLSFEMSSGARLMFINGGMPGPAGADWNPAARATASHNTLCLAEKSSSQLVSHHRLETLIGAPPIRYPDQVDWQVADAGDGVMLEASHDGYARRFGLIHSRRLFLALDGRRLEGRDRLDGSRQNARLKSEITFSIHFHLHPDVGCRVSEDARSAELELADGQRWLFEAEGVPLAVEESTFFANSTGPRGSLQIVLRAATLGESVVDWSVARLKEGKAA
jgi:uncharacterized heparinase superfamily protein